MLKVGCDRNAILVVMCVILTVRNAILEVTYAILAVIAGLTRHPMHSAVMDTGS